MSIDAPDAQMGLLAAIPRTLEFFVPGTPQTAGSKSAVPMKDGSARVIEAGTSQSRQAKKSWRGDVRTTAQAAIFQAHVVELDSIWPSQQALAIEVVFIRRRPAGHFGTGKNAGTVKDSAPRFPLTRPDATKLLRAAEDALTGIVWIDDAQIVDQHVFKRFAPYGEPEGMRMVVRVID